MVTLSPPFSTPRCQQRTEDDMNCFLKNFFIVMCHFLHHYNLCHLSQPTLHIPVPTKPTHDTCFEFISTHISGEWHLAALQSKECGWETKGKVTLACVITLGNVFVCSICPSKALSSKLVKKPNTMAILNLCQCWSCWRNKHIKVGTVKGLVSKSTRSMCTLCTVIQRGGSCFHTHFYWHATILSFSEWANHCSKQICLDEQNFITY